VGNRTTVFATDADTREEIIDVIVDRYDFTRDEVDAALSVDTEDRESTTDDRGDTREASKRLEDALDVLGDFIERNRDAASTSPEVLTALALIENRLLERSAWFPEEVRVKVRDDRARYEVRGEDGERVRVEVKDGEVRIKSREGDDDDHDDNDEDEDEREDHDDDRNRVGTSTSAGFLEVEADVFTDVTIVKVELAGKTTVFTTDADTRSEVVDEVEDRFSALSKAQIDAALDFEIEDRASRTQDLDDEDSSDDSDDDDSSGRSGNDDDEDEDDDSSGHGGSGDDDEEEDEDEDEEDDEDSSGSGSGRDDDEDDN